MKRELRLIAHDSDLIMILLIAPLFYMLFYGAFYYNKAESKIPVAVVDLDKSISSKRLAYEITSHSMLTVPLVTGNFEEAKLALYKRDVYAVMVIPKDYERDVKTLKGGNMNVFLNNTQFLISNDINRSINDIKAYHDKASSMHFIEMGGVSGENAQYLSEPIHPEIRPVFNTGDNYGSFLLPGLFILILQQTLFIGLGESVGKERETKTFSELYKISGKNVSVLMFGKGLFYIVLFTVYTFLVLLAAYPSFKIGFNGSLLVFIVMMILFLMTHISFSMFLSSFLKNKLQGLVIVAFTAYPFMMVSGYVWPLTSMPPVIKAISYCIPGSIFLQNLNAMIQTKNSLPIVLPAAIELLVMFVVYTLLNHWRYTKLEEEAE
jgi:ABC-2 type transport system permease protein